MKNRGHGRRAKGTTLREHRARKHHRPAQLFTDLDDDQDETVQRFTRRQLKPGPSRSLAIDDVGDKDPEIAQVTLREQTWRLLTEIPEEWDGLIQQTFDHTSTDQALLTDSLQSLFSLDLNELADSLESLPSHVVLRLHCDFIDDQDEIIDHTIVNDIDIIRQSPELMMNAQASPSSAAKAVVGDSIPNQPSPMESSAIASPTGNDSDQDLDDLLEFANHTLSTSRDNSRTAAAGDSDSEIDRLLDDL